MSSSTWVHRLFQEKPSTQSRSFPTRYSVEYPRSEFRRNRVVNSRYTWYNFLLLNIIEQFRRPLNLYFLGVGLMQLISIITPVHPASTLVPLAGAFLITALKDGYDDFNIHLEDSRANAVPYKVLRPSTYAGNGVGFENVRSEDLLVGDVVLLSEEQEVSSDVVVVATANDDGCAYITTANLDGEIDLKERFVPRSFAGAQDEIRNAAGDDPETSESFVTALVKHLNCRFEAAPPDDRVHEFSGAVEVGGQRCALSSEHLLLSSTTVKNTRWCVAVVVYTGCETKVAMCRTSAPVKWARLDQSVSKLSGYVFALQMTVMVGFGTVGALLQPSQREHLWYLHEKDPGVVDYAVMPGRFFLLTSVMIPISFKVMIDVSKLWVARTISWDVEMDYPDNQLTPDEATRCVVNNTAIAEDLGQVAHVLTDKTGTLTQNAMLLRGVFLSPSASELSPPPSTPAPPRVAAWRRRGAAEDDDSGSTGVGTLHLSSAVQIPLSMTPNVVYTSTDVVHDVGRVHTRGPAPAGTLRDSDGMGYEPPVVASSGIVPTIGDSVARPATPPPARAFDPASHPLLNADGERETPYTPSVTQSPPPAPTGSRARAMSATEVASSALIPGEFPPRGLAWRSRAMLAMFRHLALCHTVTVEAPVEGEESELVGMMTGPAGGAGGTGPVAIPRYRASSPDEEALVLAAARAGVVLLSRSRTLIVLNVCGVEEAYTVEDTLPFTSTRKRMSIVISPANDAARAALPGVTLLMKGADDRTVGRVQPIAGVVDHVGVVGSTDSDQPFNIDALSGSLLSTLTEVANSGLRTLVHAQATLDGKSFSQWRGMRAASEANNVGDAREIAVAKLCCQLEKSLVLVGCTAIEDRLQEGVPRTIQLLQQAGIVVWMLTGDKKETAQEISLSANLAQPARGDRFLNLGGDSEAAVRGAMDECLREVAAFGSRRSTAAPRRPLLATQTGSDSDGGPVTSSVPHHATLRGRSVSNRRAGSRPNDSLPLDAMHDASAALAGGGLRSRSGSASSRGRGGGRGGKAVIMLGTESLPFIIQAPDLKESFIQLAGSECVGSVVCYRMTPAQKASVVKLVKETGSLTLAVGDGGNDCAMLREAHVGVGLRGREGRQAARSADYAVGQFRFLQDLLFVHGHWAYHRTAYIVQYSYYKSMFISFAQLCFNFYTGVSGNAFWDSIHLASWNGAFTVPNILAYVLDRDVPRERLLQFPVLYKYGLHGMGLTRSSFIGFLLRGVVHAALLFWCTVAFYTSYYGSYVHPSGRTDGSAIDGRPPTPLEVKTMDNSLAGKTIGYQGMFIPPYLAALLVQSLVVTMESFSITWINWLCIWLIGPAYVVFITAYTSFNPSIDSYMTFLGYWISDPSFFLGVIVMVALAFVPLLAFTAFRRAVMPDLRERLLNVINDPRFLAREAEQKARTRPTYGTSIPMERL